jgi:hypothetical protein
MHPHRDETESLRAQVERLNLALQNTPKKPKWVWRVQRSKYMKDDSWADGAFAVLIFVCFAWTLWLITYAVNDITSGLVQRGLTVPLFFSALWFLTCWERVKVQED